MIEFVHDYLVGLGVDSQLFYNAECNKANYSVYASYGVNAIEYAARLIGRSGDMGERPARPKHHDSRFDPPVSTVQTGVIKGGRAVNILPAKCEFDFEIGALPDFDHSPCKRGSPRTGI